MLNIFYSTLLLYHNRSRNCLFNEATADGTASERKRAPKLPPTIKRFISLFAANVGADISLLEEIPFLQGCRQT